jgi:hypothetical protein
VKPPRRNGGIVDLEDVLRSAIVRIDIDESPSGTGFFVAPGHVLTCAHVINPDILTSPDPLSVARRARIQVRDGNGGKHEITAAPGIDSETDLAWLSVAGTLPDLPVPLLSDGMAAGDELWTYGFPVGKTAGVPATFAAEGKAGGPPRLLKFKGGQVQYGMSGAPLLNKRTGAVCGIVRRTRDDKTAAGGYAISVKQFETCRFHRNLRSLKAGADPEWLNLLSPEQSRYLEQLGASDVELVINVTETVNRWKANGTLFTGPDHNSESLGGITIDLNRVRGDVARLFRAWKTQRRIGNKEQAQLLGQVLYRAALKDKFASALESRVFGEPGGKVNISICFDSKAPQDLVHLPWEQLYVPYSDEHGDAALGMDRRTTLTRVLDADRSFSYLYPTADSMNILVIEAPYPPKEGRKGGAATAKPAIADSHQVATAVETVLRKYPGRIYVTNEGIVSRRALRDRVRAQAAHAFTVVHYVGYARFYGNEDELALCKSDGKGGVDWVGEHGFADALHDPAPQLVVLQACTAPDSDRDLVPGDLTVLAKCLLRQGVKAVIACQFPIPDIQAANQLNESLYEGLAAGESVRVAVQEARDRLSERPWTQPALFAQHPGDLYLLPRQRPAGIVMGPSTRSTSGWA